MKFLFAFAGLAAALLAIPCLAPAQDKPAKVSISIEMNQTVHFMKGGIGASWHAIEKPIPVVDGRSHGGSGWGGNPPAQDDQAWKQVFQHADWLGFDFCRVELEQRMYEPERGQFNWGTPELRILYRILDWCEKRRVDVFLQQMWANVEWNAYPEFRGDTLKILHSAPYSMDVFANSLTALVRHLVQERRYSCIKWLCINNEPGYDWSWWQAPPNQPLPIGPGLKAVRAALDRAGISIPLSGPDQTDLPELQPSQIDFDGAIGAYDLHSYFARFDWEERNGYPLRDAEKRLKPWIDWAHARGKPFFLSELGSMAFGWNGANPGPSTLPAALKDVELVLRAMNLGTDGFNRWSYLNRGDLDGHWEMLETWDATNQRLLKKFTPRRASYYFYGLLSRFTARQSSVLKTIVQGGELSGCQRVFSSALRSPGGHLTWFILNDAPTAWRAELKLNQPAGRPLYQYQSSAALMEKEAIRVQPLKQVRGDTQVPGFSEELPPQSLTVYSTFKLGPADVGIVADKAAAVAK